MAEKTSSNKDSFGYLYHLETIKQGKVGLSSDNKPVTAYVDGVEHNNKVYNLPLYDRDTGKILSHEQALTKFKPQIETGEIESFALLKGKFEQGEDTLQNHPANIRAKEEHQKIDLYFQQSLDPNLIAHQNIKLPSSETVQFKDPVSYRSISRSGELLEKGARDVASRAYINKAIKIAEQQKNLTEAEKTRYEKIIKNSNKETFVSRYAASNPYLNRNLQIIKQQDLADAEAVLNPNSVEILLQKAVDISAEEAGISFSPETQKFLENKGSMWEDFISAPLTILTELTLTQAPNMVMTIGASVAGGMAAGPAGFIAGGSVMAARLDYIGRLQEKLQRDGVNLNDPNAIRMALEDPEVWEDAKAAAARGSTVVGLTNAVGGAYLPFAKTVGQKIAGTAAAPFVESGGEAGAQLASEGEVYSPIDVAAEGLASGVPSVAEAISYYGTQPNVELEADPDNALPLYAANPEGAQANQFPFPDETFTSKARSELFNLVDPNEKRSAGFENVEVTEEQFQDALRLIEKKGLVKKSEMAWSGLDALEFAEIDETGEKEKVTLQGIANLMQEHDIIKLMTTDERRGSGGNYSFDDEITFDEQADAGYTEGYGDNPENFTTDHDVAINALVGRPIDSDGIQSRIETMDTLPKAAINRVGSLAVVDTEYDYVEETRDVIEIPNYSAIFQDRALLEQRLTDNFMDFMLTERDINFEDQGGDPSNYSAAYRFALSGYLEKDVERITSRFLNATANGFLPWMMAIDESNVSGAGFLRNNRDPIDVTQEQLSEFNEAWQEYESMLRDTYFVFNNSTGDTEYDNPLWQYLKDESGAWSGMLYIHRKPNGNIEIFDQENAARDSVFNHLSGEYSTTSSGDFDSTSWSSYVPDSYEIAYEYDPIGYVELSMQIKPRDEEGMKVIGTGTGHGFPEGTYAHVRGGYLTENNERKFRLVEIQSDWAQNASNDQSMPFMEQDSWATMGIKNLLVHMVDHGVDVLEIPWGSIQTDLYGTGDETKGVAYFYNRILMNRLKFLKSYGIQPETVAEGQDTFNQSRYVPDVLMAENYVRNVKVVEAPKDTNSIEQSKTLDGKEIDPNEDYYLIEVPPNDRAGEYVDISATVFDPIDGTLDTAPTYYSVGAGEKAKIVFFKTEKQARKFVEPLKKELIGTLVGGYRRIKLTEELKDAIREGNLPLFSESWRTKLSTAKKPEITIKTKAKKQTLLDIDKKPLTDIPDSIKDVLPFTGENKNSFAAGLDSLIDAGMPKILINSVKQFGQMPSKNRSGVTYPDQGIIAINQKELADANKGEANARWSVTSLLAHELGHIPDAINRMPEFNDQDLSNELLSWSSEYFWNQDLGLNGLENIKLNAEFIENFGPITQEAYNIYRNDIEGYAEFLGYPFDSLMTSINVASTGVTGPIKTLVGEVQAQMSALYRINPELLAKHAPEAYKFYKGLDNELNTEKTASLRSAKKIRRHFRSSSPTRGTQSLQLGETSRDGRGGPDEGGALYGMGAKDQNQNRLDNGRLVRYDATKVKPSGGSAGTVVTVKDLAEYFTKDHNQRHKKRKLDVSKTRDKNIVIDKGVADLEFQMTQDITGKGWYDQDIADAIEITSEIIPELKTVKHMPSLLLVVAGVTSPASEVPMNWQVATEVMMNYVKDGVFPRVKTVDSFSGNPNTAWDPRGSSKKALDFMNWLVGQYGETGAAEYLLTEHKIKDLRKIKIDSGVYTSHGIAGNQDTETLGTLIFGPKVGAFIANLHGVEDVTIDLWMTKAHNRHTGKLLEGNVGSDGTVSTPRNDTERKLMQEWVYNVADRTGNTARDAQAILWFYEQYLYRSLGIKAEPKGFSDGAKQIVNKIVSR